MPIRTNRHAGQWLWDPQRRQFLSKATQTSQFRDAARARVSGLLPEPKGQDGGLGPGRPRNALECFGVSGRTSPSRLGCRPAGDLSGELR